jgi:hypothetical protein
VPLGYPCNTRLAEVRVLLGRGVPKNLPLDVAEPEVTVGLACTDGSFVLSPPLNVC